MRTDILYRKGLISVILADIFLNQKNGLIFLYRILKLTEKICDPVKQLAMQILE